MNASTSKIIAFPVANTQRKHDYDADIDEVLASVPVKAREKIRFALIRTIDSYDEYFSEWSLSLPEDGDETLKKQLYDVAHQEHGRKVRMLKDIMLLKARILVAEFHQSR